MSFAFFIAALVCLLGVAATLFRGLFAMARNAPRAGNRLMQLRVGLQGLAVVFLLLAYLTR